MLTNEITDFIQRALKKRKFDGVQILDYAAVRKEWLASIASGSGAGGFDKSY